MKNNQLAYQHKDIYENVKKYDVNALRAFMFESTKDVTDAIEYWEKRKTTLLKPEEKAQLDIISIEIMRLEAILLAKSQLTVDFFNIANLSTVMADSDLISHGTASTASGTKEVVDISQKSNVIPSEDKMWGLGTFKGLITDLFKDKSVEEIKEYIKKDMVGTTVDEGNGVKVTIKTEAEFEAYFTKMIIPIINESKGKEGKIIQMHPEKIKLGDLADKCRSLLTEGKKKEAKDMANKYLLSANYIPKKDNQKAEKWHDARIESWLKELTKNVPAQQSQTKDSSKEKTTPETNTAAGTQKTNTATTSDSAKTVETEKENDSAELSISMEHYDLFLAWLKKIGINPVDILGEELMTEFSTPEGRKTYGSFVVEFSNPDAVIATLKEEGIEALYYTEDKGEEETESTDELDPKMFFNESNTLTEELQHIENLLKLTHELRGDKQGSPENMDKVKELAGLFFDGRSKEDYEDKSKFITSIESRPAVIKTVKEFVSHMSYGKLNQYQEVDPKDPKKKTTDCYHKVVDEITKLCKESDFEEKHLPGLVKKLKGTILAGKTSDGKQVVNKVTFYTTYHVLHFIDQIVESTKMGEANATASNTVATDASTSQEAGASKKETSTEDQSSTEKVKTLVDSYEAAILNIIKNNGIITDAETHPDVVALNGMTVPDPWSPGQIKIEDKNISKYLVKKWTEIKETWEATLTEFPVNEMARLIAIAVHLKQSAEDFVKDNLHLVKKKDKYLALTGKLEDITVNIPIKSDEDFLKYVKDTYALEEKLTEEANKNAVVYELSKYASFKAFEEAVLAKAGPDKTPLAELQEWAKTEILNKTFTGETNSEPVFRTDNEKNLYTYVELITKKLYETPETKAAAEAKIKAHALSTIKEYTGTLLTFVNELRRFCNDQKIDTSLKYLKEEIVVPTAKEHNKKMYDQYLKLTGDLKENKLLADKKETTPAAEVKEKKVIVETPAKNEKSENLEKEIMDLVGVATTEADLKEALEGYDYEANKVAILKAVKSVVCDKKQVTDMKMSEAEANEWLTKLYTKAPLAEETSKTATTDQTTDVNKQQTDSAANSDTVTDPAGTAQSKESGTKVEGERKEYVNETFDELGSASDKSNFKKALSAIVEKFNDSAELRNAICEAIKSGKGGHTVKVAKQIGNNLAEAHKMIKKAYENYEEALVQATV